MAPVAIRRRHIARNFGRALLEPARISRTENDQLTPDAGECAFAHQVVFVCSDDIPAA